MWDQSGGGEKKEGKKKEKRKTELFGAMSHSFPPLNVYKLISGYTSAKALEDLPHWSLEYHKELPAPFGSE